MYALETELTQWLATRSAGTVPPRESKGIWSLRRLLGVVLVAVTTAALLAAGAAVMQSPIPSSTRVFELPVVPTQTGWSENDDYNAPAIDPLGRRVAFIRDGHIQIRELDATESRTLGDTGGAERL